MPRLKMKEDLRYRKGHTNDSQNCKTCENFKAHFPVFGIGVDGTPIRIESRCALIGLEQSRHYNVRADYTCDRQHISDAYEREVKAWLMAARLG
jgi:hypothetical protein